MREIVGPPPSTASVGRRAAHTNAEQLLNSSLNPCALSSGQRVLDGACLSRGREVSAVTRKFTELAENALCDSERFSRIAKPARSRRTTVKQKYAIDKSGSRPSW